ncbi:ankyrin-1-like [Lineus longissimus]|uniref:ankyrin-1-like n=1 Tax=Lineus longissimus TaxID=88925 RepID=UPI00315E00F7
MSSPERNMGSRQRFLDDGLNYACHVGNCVLAESCLSKGASVNASCQRTRQNPLYSAIRQQKFKVVQVLLQYGADAKLGLSYLQSQVASSPSILELLLERGAAEDSQSCTSLLDSACYFGNEEIVDIVLDHCKNKLGLPVAVFKSMCRNPLFHACMTDKRSIIIKLIAFGADVNVVNSVRSTPLHRACQTGHIDLVDALLQRGARITEDEDGDTPLDIAYRLGSKDIFKLLIDKGAKSERLKSYQLHLACFVADESRVGKLLEKGMDLNAADMKGRTPLHCTCFSGEPKLVDKLLNLGADINVTDDDATSALHIATFLNQFGMVQHLLEYSCKKPDVNVITKLEKWTPLHFACCSGDYGIAKLLLENGADVHVFDRDNNQPLSLACCHGSPATSGLVKLLLSFDADINLSCSLHMALKSDDLDVFDLLLDYGADVTIRGDQGLTPLEVAAREGKLEFVKKLFSRFGVMKEPHRPLHAACISSQLHVVKYLIEKCPMYLEQKDSNGYSPFMFVFTSGIASSMYSTLDFLIKYGCDLDCLEKDEGKLLAKVYRENYYYFTCLIQEGCGSLRKAGRVLLDEIIKHRDTYCIHLLMRCVFRVDSSQVIALTSGLEPDSPKAAADHAAFISQFLDLTSQPVLLQDLCRCTIRKCIKQHRRTQLAKIGRLPVPTRLKDFLAFSGDEQFGFSEMGEIVI